MAAPERSPDALGIDQLVKSGSDPSKLHHIDFTLRFTTQKAAERAELQLMGFAFVTKIERGKATDQWIVTGTKKMYPLESDIVGLRDKLDAIAAESKGTYEGWRARVVAGQ
jgi:regulator of RNase E activity RraB